VAIATASTPPLVRRIPYRNEAGQIIYVDETVVFGKS
jgi:hypothetical protein